MKFYQDLGGASDRMVLLRQQALELDEKVESSTPGYVEAIGLDFEKVSPDSILRVVADVVASNSSYPNSWSARIDAGGVSSAHFKGSKVHLVESLGLGPVRVGILWAAPAGGTNRADPTLGPSTPEGMTLLVEEYLRQ